MLAGADAPVHEHGPLLAAPQLKANRELFPNVANFYIGALKLAGIDDAVDAALPFLLVVLGQEDVFVLVEARPACEIVGDPDVALCPGHSLEVLPLAELLRAADDADALAVPRLVRDAETEAVCCGRGALVGLERRLASHVGVTLLCAHLRILERFLIVGLHLS